MELLDILLSPLGLGAALSLEPLLELTGTLARDLQDDFLPHLPRVAAVLADLVDEGAAAGWEVAVGGEGKQ